jgi:hypothetical protein
VEQQIALFRHEFDLIPGLCNDVKSRLELCDIDQQQVIGNVEGSPMRFKDMALLHHGYCQYVSFYYIEN